MVAFDAAFQSEFARLCRWRRDVRRFSTQPVAQALVDELLEIAHGAPSVGNSQPWRWLRIESQDMRAAIQDNFRRANLQAAEIYSGDRAELYARLKLEGLEAAPVQFAVFCDRTTEQGLGLGRQSMPETLDYSVVTSITTFWLAARAHGLGVGWVSIIEADEIGKLLEAPPAWRLISYLCVGWPLEEHDVPELEREGWQVRTALSPKLSER
ncbi:MAG TPA: 5,6-dimethylbenzimidazole synthase [Beijerinckiaceae bacterium]|nr:5,6-dimethylbenzimidazole synthase [Beijerinckiaceae bacterium]